MRKGSNHSEESRRKIGIAGTGRRLSDTAKLKLSIFNKGKKLTEEHKLKLSRAKKGIRFSDEHIRNLSLAHKGKPSGHLGKKRSEESKLKMRLSHLGRVGELAGNWRGGITPANKLVRTSIEYMLWRKSVFEIDNYTCRSCGKRGGEIHAHHILSFAKFSHKRFDITNGITLCKPCHGRVHASNH